MPVDAGRCRCSSYYRTAVAKQVALSRFDWSTSPPASRPASRLVVCAGAYWSNTDNTTQCADMTDNMTQCTNNTDNTVQCTDNTTQCSEAHSPYSQRLWDRPVRGEASCGRSWVQLGDHWRLGVHADGEFAICYRGCKGDATCQDFAMASADTKHQHDSADDKADNKVNDQADHQTDLYIVKDTTHSRSVQHFLFPANTK